MKPCPTCLPLVLRPAEFQSAYHLFVHAKPDKRVRVLYDLSPLTPFLSRPHCRLPRSLDLLGDSDARFAIKIDLADGFFQIPVHPGLQPFLGVRYASRSYVWTVLPMGLATAPSLMQTVMGAIARLVMARCPAVKARVYLDDFLFSAPAPDLLIAIPDLLRSWGLQLNVRKSQLLPCRQLTYLGLSLDLAERRLFVTERTRSQVLCALRALPSFSSHHASKLAGYLNFIPWVAKLPLALIIAVLRRDPMVQTVLPYLDAPWEFSSTDYHNWFREHPRWMAADATPSCIGLADPSAAVSLPIPEPTPIYQAELAAALLATSVAEPATTIYIDNVAALVNVHKGRCPLPGFSGWFPSSATALSHTGMSGQQSTRLTYRHARPDWSPAASGLEALPRRRPSAEAPFCAYVMLSSCCFHVIALAMFIALPVLCSHLS